MEEGEDPEAITDCWLPGSLQGDCSHVSAAPSRTMEGEEMSPSHHSEESSMLDLPSAGDLVEHFLPPHGSESSEELFGSVNNLPSLPSGESTSPSAVPVSFSAGGWEEATLRCSSVAGQPEPPEPSSAAPSFLCQPDSAEDTSIRAALDDFYQRYCRRRPDRRGPTYEAAAQCLSERLSELAHQDGTKYASRCLQMAQLVLNRDGCKVFPNHPTAACFAVPAEGAGTLGASQRTPGLSDDVLQLLLKHRAREHSPGVPQQK
ncbi:shieldin complex subunit 1 [Melanerpes formicivorus]|uniref:shieldin complex subunit 1 n=1 Tax=Melanerpes formicivorus TaxID=211600 RepID=UPI00358F7D3D